MRPALGVRREAEAAHAGFASRVHEDERDEERRQEHLDDRRDLEPDCEDAEHSPRQDSDSLPAWPTDDARERIQKLLVTGDNRLKQGVDPAKVRESYEEALAVAREAGLEETVRPLVEVRLADLERLAAGSPPPEPPAA